VIHPSHRSAVIVINIRLQDSRIGRAWEAIREDEVAARAMGINTRNIKLLAFAMGASFGGVAGGMFSAIQGFISPESFVLVESVMVLAMVVLGGMGNIWGVILGALLLSFDPRVLHERPPFTAAGDVFLRIPTRS
jgi:branched-chain amino acid transport system permease protein